MIEQLRQIWFGMSLRAKFITLGSIFLILAIFIFVSVFSRDGIPSPSRKSSVEMVLNEVLFSPSQNQFQFIELKGISESGALAGFALLNERKEKYILPSAAPPLKPNAHLLIVFDGENKFDGTALHADRKAFLNNTAGFVELLAPDGRVLDRVAWGRRQAESVNMGRGGAHAGFIAGTSIGRYPLSVKNNNSLEWLTFSQEEVTPGKPNPNPRAEVLLPLDGAYFSKPSIELSWYPVAGAKSYRIQISKNVEFSAIFEDKTTQAPSFNTPALKEGEYFWRVQAISADGSAANFSPVSSFTISSTELPTFPKQTSRSLFPSAFAAETVPPLREGVLAVPMIYQHKDTAMLLMESTNESGAHAWDKDHKELDKDDPADNMNCALASTAMVNNYSGGDLSQDRIGYEIRKGDSPDDPMLDLNYGKGLSFREDIDEDEIDDALTFAFNGATVTRHIPTTAEAFWEMVTREIDAGKPVVTRVPGHAIVISGYYQFSLTGPNARWVTINDPWSGRYLVNLSRMRRVTHYWLVSDTSNPRRNEAGITQDSDGDGIVDFDETERFKTNPNNRDSDHDGVDDKTEVYATVFDPNHGWSLHRTFGFGRDFDGDGKPMELDEDSDGGGCNDGEEDKNFNGKRDGGETYNFDKEDDKCGSGTEWAGEIIAKRVHLSADGVGNWTARYYVRLQEKCPDYDIARTCSLHPSEACGFCALEPLELKYEVEANEVLDKHNFGVYPAGKSPDDPNVGGHPVVPHNRSVTGKASGLLRLGGNAPDKLRLWDNLHGGIYRDKQAPVSPTTDRTHDPRESEAERYWNSCLAGVPKVTGQPAYRIGISLQSGYGSQDLRAYSDNVAEVLNPLLAGIERSGPDLQEGKGNLHPRSGYAGPVLDFWLCGQLKSPDDNEMSGEHAFSSFSNDIDQLYSGPTQVNISWKLKRKK